MKLKLVKPIKMLNGSGRGLETVSEIELKDPTGKDFAELDDPVTTIVGATAEGRSSYHNSAAWIHRIAGIDAEAQANLHAADSRRIMNWISQQLALEPGEDAGKNSERPSDTSSSTSAGMPNG